MTDGIKILERNSSLSKIKTNKKKFHGIPKLLNKYDALVWSVLGRKSTQQGE